MDERLLWVAPVLQAFSSGFCGHFCQYRRLSGLFVRWCSADYFSALRDTPVSLYEVSDVKPGTSMVLQDLLGGAGSEAASRS
ncbi:hypothetical protein [Roseovarius marisflavi]|uniref:hypothetical protein n=1 Tax=Roseovarius marisflavi TaxID=1054996 RepID=UPI001114B692|nr:hypothetical protein [Roseovarius marisflavi]